MHQAIRDTRPGEERRLEARATIKPGETLGAGGAGGQLVRLVLTDAGPVEDEGGATVDRADVVCTLTPEEARRRAIELLHAAERAENARAHGVFLATFGATSP
jgi:hypothetical protein